MTRPLPRARGELGPRPSVRLARTIWLTSTMPTRSHIAALTAEIAETAGNHEEVASVGCRPRGFGVVRLGLEQQSLERRSPRRSSPPEGT